MNKKLLSFLLFTLSTATQVNYGMEAKPPPFRLELLLKIISLHSRMAKAQLEATGDTIYRNNMVMQTILSEEDTNTDTITSLQNLFANTFMGIETLRASRSLLDDKGEKLESIVNQQEGEGEKFDVDEIKKMSQAGLDGLQQGIKDLEQLQDQLSRELIKRAPVPS